jgi:hypothetical protein
MRMTLIAMACAAMLAAGCLSASPGYAPSGANDTASLSAISDMKDLLRAGQSAEYVATYIVNYSILENSSVISETYYVKGKNARVDIQQDNVSGSVFKIGNDTYSCEPLEGNMTCTVASVNVTEDQNLADSLLANIDTYNVSIMPDRTILGITAKCFKVGMREGSAAIPDVVKPSMMSEDFSFGYCFSQEGIPLEFKSPFSIMLITGINKTVPDSAFILPAKPQ